MDGPNLLCIYLSNCPRTQKVFWWLQVMVTVSDITANNVTVRKVNSAGLHSLDEMHPMASMSAPAVNALNEPIAANGAPAFPAHFFSFTKETN